MWNGPTGDLGLPAVRPVAVGDRVGSGHAPVERVAQELVLKKKYATATLVQVFHILIWIWPKYVCYSWGHLVNLGTLVKLYKNLRKWKIWQISELCRRINMSWRSKWGKMVQLQYLPRLSHMLCSSNHVDLLAPTGALVFIPTCAIFSKSCWFKDINYDHHIIISLYHQT